MEEEKKQETGKKKKVLTRIGIVFLVLVIAALAAVIYWLLNRKEEPESRMPSEGLIVDEADEVEDPTFTTDMNMGWSFPSGGRTSTDAYIANSTYNKHDIYFEVYLDDENETLLYSSPVLPVGKKLKELKLDKSLPDGMYSAMCTFHLLDNDDPDKEISQVSFGVTLAFGDAKASGNQSY